MVIQTDKCGCNSPHNFITISLYIVIKWTVRWFMSPIPGLILNTHTHTWPCELGFLILYYSNHCKHRQLCKYLSPHTHWTAPQVDVAGSAWHCQESCHTHRHVDSGGIGTNMVVVGAEVWRGAGVEAQSITPQWTRYFTSNQFPSCSEACTQTQERDHRAQRLVNTAAVEDIYSCGSRLIQKSGFFLYSYRVEVKLHLCDQCT